MMKRLSLLILLGCIAILLAACSGQTTGATGVEATYATLNVKGVCDSGQTCKVWIIYGTTNTPASTWASTTPETIPGGSYSHGVEVAPLSAGTGYAYELAATQSNEGTQVYYYDQNGNVYLTPGDNVAPPSGSTEPNSSLSIFTTLGRNPL